MLTCPGAGPAGHRPASQGRPRRGRPGRPPGRGGRGRAWVRIGTAPRRRARECERWRGGGERASASACPISLFFSSPSPRHETRPRRVGRPRPPPTLTHACGCVCSHSSSVRKQPRVDSPPLPAARALGKVPLSHAVFFFLSSLVFLPTYTMPRTRSGAGLSGRDQRADANGSQVRRGWRVEGGCGGGGLAEKGGGGYAAAGGGEREREKTGAHMPPLSVRACRTPLRSGG